MGRKSAITECALPQGAWPPEGPPRHERGDCDGSDNEQSMPLQQSEQTDRAPTNLPRALASNTWSRDCSLSVAVGLSSTIHSASLAKSRSHRPRRRGLVGGRSCSCRGTRAPGRHLRAAPCVVKFLGARRLRLNNPPGGAIMADGLAGRDRGGQVHRHNGKGHLVDLA